MNNQHVSKNESGLMADAQRVIDWIMMDRMDGRNTAARHINDFVDNELLIALNRLPRYVEIDGRLFAR